MLERQETRGATGVLMPGGKTAWETGGGVPSVEMAEVVRVRAAEGHKDIGGRDEKDSPPATQPQCSNYSSSLYN